MIKVTGYGTVGGTQNVGKRRAASGTGSSFADLLSASEAGETERTGGVSELSATGGITNLLALQEVSEEETKRRRALKHGANLLDSLEDLRRQLLIGTLPPSVLINLSRELAAQKQEIIDPRITDLVEEIELRAAVELAKIEKAIEDRNNAT